MCSQDDEGSQHSLQQNNEQSQNEMKWMVFKATILH